MIGSFCTLTTENSLFLAVSIISVPINKHPSRVELWHFPTSSKTPSTLSQIGEQCMGQCAFQRANY